MPHFLLLLSSLPSLLSFALFLPEIRLTILFSFFSLADVLDGWMADGQYLGTLTYRRLQIA